MLVVTPSGGQAGLETHQETLTKSPQTFTYPFFQNSKDFGKVFARFVTFIS